MPEISALVFGKRPDLRAAWRSDERYDTTRSSGLLLDGSMANCPLEPGTMTELFVQKQERQNQETLSSAPTGSDLGVSGRAFKWSRCHSVQRTLCRRSPSVSG